MADFVFNISKGRVVELARNVDGGPASGSVVANARLVVSLWNISTADDTIRDYDDLASIEADAGAAELTSGTNANYARKSLAGADVTVTVTDAASNWVDVDITDQTWTALGAGTAITDLIIAYDHDNSAGTDANIIPMTQHDFAVTPDGSDVTAQIASSGFFRAT